MKKYVWSETRVEGGRHFSGKLAKPPTISGPFQDMPIVDFLATFTGQPPKTPPDYYADSAVIAFRAPETDAPLSPQVTSSAGAVDGKLLSDGRLSQTVSLPIPPVGQQAWIQLEFAKPQSIQALTFSDGSPGGFLQRLFGAPSGPDFEASVDGRSFSRITTVPTDGAVEHTIAFPPTTARFFRLTYTSQPPAKSQGGIASEIGLPSPPPPTHYRIAELVLHGGARVNRFEEKAGFATLPDLYTAATPSVSAKDAVHKAEVLDLSAKMRPDGTLDWNAPEGHWVVLRMGYALTGMMNHPASPEGTGLEVDKLNAADVKQYMETYLSHYESAVGSLMGKRGLRCLISDSWEAGTQNWTDEMIGEFTRRRGYDPLPWLPVLTGRVVESARASDRFLWDFRRTLADLLAENHYDQITAILKAHNLCHYGESHEAGRAFIGDGMEVKRSNDVPMGAMWTQRPGINDDQPQSNADLRESASVAHLYGGNLVAAESLTAASGPWAWSPATLKPTADKELAMGLNRFVIHTSVHQPVLDKTPGLGLGPFGQWFTRNETWAEPAQAWVTYLARSSFLLQQGHFAADIAYFYGEDSNVTALFGKRAPEVPPGYGFDYINADALVHLLTVENGQLTTPSGMRYRVLALDPYSQHMSLPVLRKIRDLVSAGAVVVGSKPLDTPSLGDDASEFDRIANDLWGSSPAERESGRGKVYGKGQLVEVLTSRGIAPDFEYTRPGADTNLLFVHRKLASGDIYYVDNRNNRAESVQATFRIDGKEAELWHADTGRMEPASFRVVDGRTTVPLSLEPWGTVFVVFRTPAKAAARTLADFAESSIATVQGSWDVSFQADRGAPSKISLARLSSWSDSADLGVKYFSGTATYTKVVVAPRDWFQHGARLWIDLGDVKELAEVSVNDTPLGVLWKTPFRADATEALKPGANRLTIKVTNLWVNRMIGDTQSNASRQYSFAVPPRYRAADPLLPSGLLGPVQIVRAAAVK
jgi:hypothetical protein